MRTLRLCLLAIAFSPALAHAQAARVLLAVGDVVAVRTGQDIRLAPGTAIQSGDTIRVGPASNAQIRMSDESIIALRERTVFRIDEYSYSGQVDGSEKSIFSLLAGGMRTVTGAIGRLKRLDKYAVRTATATIGIRGTHYTLRECNEQSPCNPTSVGKGDGIEVASASLTKSDVELVAQLGAPGQGAPFGTYGGVTDGSIGVTNDTPEQVFAANQYFYVASRQAAPQSLIAPPPFLFDRLEGQSRTKGQKGKESGETLAQGGINAESRPSDVPPAPKPSEFVVTEQKSSTTGTPVVVQAAPTHGLIGAWVSADGNGGTGGAFVTASQFTLDGSGLLSSFNVPPGCIGPNEDCSGGAVGSVSNPAQAGCGSSVLICFGRWANGSITEDVGTVTNPPGGFHGLIGPLTPPEVIAAKSGTATFFSPLGTTPTNNLGEVATSASFPLIGINFLTRTGTTASSATWTFPSQTWTMASGMPLAVTVVPGQGAYLLGVTNGTHATCSGACQPNARYQIGGTFMGPLGDHIGTGISVATHLPGTQASAQAVRIYTCSGPC